MPLCSVTNCLCEKADHNGVAEGIIFHPFPSNEEMRAKWVDMTGREEGWVPGAKAFVCSRHFRDSDYTIKRSGKRYLKTSAIPCEYVVYRLPDDEPLLPQESNEAEAIEEHVVKFEECAGHQVDLPPAQEEYNYVLDEQPGTSRAFTPLQPVHEADSTIATIYDQDQSRGWQFQPEPNYELRFPAYLFEEQSSQDAADSSFDARFLREEPTAINPYPPTDYSSQMELMPSPRAPAWQIPQLPGPSAGPSVDHRDRLQQLDEVTAIMSRRRSSRKIRAAKQDEYREAKKINLQLQSGEMSNHDKAD